MIIIGIDPGQSGAIAKIMDTGDFVEVIKMPLDPTGKHIDTLNVYDFLKNYTRARIYLEEAMAGFKQSSTSTLTTGINYGELKAISKLLQYPFSEIKPNIWKAAMGITVKGASLTESKKLKKELSCKLALQLFPDAKNIITSTNSKGKVTYYDGVAEALLIAEYGRRLHLGYTVKLR